MIKVFSGFDGISCVQLSFRNLSKDCICYASEIDESAIKVTKANFPNTIHVGDIRNISGDDYKDIDFVIGGFPCQSFSMAGKRNGLQENGIIVDTLKKYLKLKEDNFVFEGTGYLFWELMRVLTEIRKHNPNVKFLFENVRMSKKWENIITNTLGVQPKKWDSTLVSVQHRERTYWSNIPNVIIPQDKGLLLNSIIPDAVSGAGWRGVADPNRPMYHVGSKYKRTFTVRKDRKSNCIVTSPSSTNLYKTVKGEVKTMTPEQCELAQTIPVGHTNVKGITKTQRHKMIGNAMTVDIISEFVKHL